MKECEYKIGDAVVMTADAIERRLHKKGSKVLNRGVVLIHNNITGTIVVLRDGERQRRIYLEKFWQKA